MCIGIAVLRTAVGSRAGRVKEMIHERIDPFRVWLCRSCWRLRRWAAAQESCPSSACLTCPTGQTYRIVYQTVYEQRQFTAYRIEYETVCEERQVTTYKPVWETAVRENRYTVARPVMETAEREETYTVQRPVYETAERDESYTVMKPVYETAYRTECHTVLQPVTTCQTQYVDQGCFAEQMVLKPALPATRLAWQSGACAVDPVTGQTVYQRAGLVLGADAARPVRGSAGVASERRRPASAADELRAADGHAAGADAGLQVRARAGRAARCRCRCAGWSPSSSVRKVPVTTCKMVYEERVEQVPYQVCRMVAEQQTIRVPHCVEKRIPVTYTYNVPRVVCYRVPLDACGKPMARVVGGERRRQCERCRAEPVQPHARPTPAKKAAGADVKPELGPDAATPQPVDAEEKQPAKEAAPMQGGAPAGEESRAVGGLPVEEHVTRLASAEGGRDAEGESAAGGRRVARGGGCRRVG